MPNAHHLLFCKRPGVNRSRRSWRLRRPWASSFATSFSASFGLGLSLGVGRSSIIDKLAIVSIGARSKNVVSTMIIGSRGHCYCGGLRTRLPVQLLVRFRLCGCSLALFTPGHFGSRRGWHSLSAIHELLSYDLALSAIDFSMCRFIKVLVLSPVRTGRGSIDTHKQRPKGNTFAKLSFQKRSWHVNIGLDTHRLKT